MIRQPVTSSNLRTVGYDPITRTLEIEFQDGAVYQYDGVPPDVHACHPGTVTWFILPSQH